MFGGPKDKIIRLALSSSLGLHYNVYDTNDDEGPVSLWGCVRRLSVGPIYL